MAKINKKIQKQLEEGLASADKFVDSQLETPAAPAPETPKTPAAAAPSAPAAGATPVAPTPDQQAPTPELQFEAAIAKVIKGNEYFVNEFRKIRDGVMRGDSPQGLQVRLQKLALAISGSTQGQLQVADVEGFLTQKVQAQASPAVRQEVLAQEAKPVPPEMESPDLLMSRETPESLGYGDEAGLQENLKMIEDAKARVAAQQAGSPETAPGGVDTLPAPQATPSVAPTGLSVDPTAPVQTPETQVTATTPDQSGLSSEELAMLQAADEQVAGQREQVDPQKDPAFRISDYFTPEEIAQMKEQGLDPYQEALDVRAFGSKKSSGVNMAPSADTQERLMRQRLQERVDTEEPEWVKKKRLQKIGLKRRAVMDFASLNPVDDLYVLFDELFGPTGIRPFEARNSMADPESYTRGSTAMRMSLFQFALGVLPKEMASDPLILKLRKRFDAIMRELGVDQDLIDTVRGDRDVAGPDADIRKPHVAKYAGQNVQEQRVAIDEIVRIIEKLKDGGSLRHPDVAPALHVLTQFISDIDSDIVNDSYIKFNPRNEYGNKIITQIDKLERVTQGLVDKVMELTGEDLRVVITEDGEIPRPGWTPLRANGVSFTANNALRYETSSRRRYALDKAGIIDTRWQEVDAQGIDVPSFVNEMHPTPDTTKAAIGFILTTDPTTDLHYAAGGRGKRDTMRESAIIKEIKNYLSETDYNDTSSTWSDSVDGDIGVGDNIEYTLDSSVVDSEVARRRSLLPTDRLVIVRLDPEEFPLGSVIQDGKGNAKGIMNHHGIIVLPEGHALIEQAIKNNARVTRPFSLGSVADISPIVEKGEFGQLLVDVDPHVFPAVKHTLPLRDPMGRKGTVAMIPITFAETVDPVRITIHDRDGIPSRKLVPILDADGNLIYANTGTQKTFSQGGAEGKHKTGKEFGIEDVLPGDVTPFVHDGRPVLRVRDVDVSASSQDWPEGIAAGIVADSDGTLPNLGTLADRYLADQDEYDVRRRWVVGDLLGVEQGEDRPGRVAAGDQLYGLMHGSVTDAEMERGLAMMREQDALIEAGTELRNMPVLSPEDEELLGKVRGRMTTNRKFSPARSPYDAAEVFDSSEDEWAVALRKSEEARIGVVETSDPFLSEIGTSEGVNYEPLTPEVAKDVRRLKAKLLFLLAIRAPKANFDRMNAEKGTRQVGDIVGFAPEIAAIRQELYRVGVTAAAVDTFIARVGERMPELTAEDKALLLSDLARPMLVTLEGVTPVSSAAGLSVSSRGYGADGLQFLTPEQAGVDPLDRLDKIAYTIASQMASEHQLSRLQGQNTLSLDRLLSEQAAKEAASDADLDTGIETTDEIASIMSETPGETRSTFTRRVPASKRVKSFAGINTTEELRIVARKAYMMYSLFAARDEAGDGWVKFINNVLHSDGAAAYIGDLWKQSGEAAILIDNRLFATKQGEIPALVTKDGKQVGFLTKRFVDILRKSTDYGSELVEFAKQNGLEFVLIKTPLRDANGNAIPGQFTDEVYITKAETDKTGKKFLNFADLSDMTSKHGYQALADETSFTRTEERIRTILKDNGADTLFDIVPTTDNSGRYVLKLRPEALIEFGLFPDAKKANQFIDNIGDIGTLDDDRIRQYKIMLDAMVKYKFYQDMNALADGMGMEQPYPDLTMKEVLAETADLYKLHDGASASGDASGPFGLRRAINRGNPNVPGEGVVPRVISKTPLPASDESPDDFVRYLARGETDFSPGVDPMLDDALARNKIIDDLDRGLDTRRVITEGRAGSPESATGRRVETETTRAMFQRARASNKTARLNNVLRGNVGQGVAGGALGLAGLAAAGQLTEDNAKTALAFEALGAVNPALSAAASLGFTGMNKGDMLRTLVNIIGGFGGAAIGSVAGTALLPVAGSFAGGMAGSVAGSTVADTLYSNLVGNGGGVEYIPENIASGPQKAVPDSQDPFSVYKKLGG
jgi:hypothetical protein